MTRTSTGHHRRFTIELALAPHVEPTWTQDVLLELRLQGVDGVDIAHALTEVEAHVVATGEDARTAFGDPVAYARALALPPADPSDARTADLVQSAAQIVGVIVLFGGASALGRDAQAAVSWGMLASALLATGATALLLRHGERALRAVVRSRVRPLLVTLLSVALVAAVVLAVLPTLLVTRTAFTLAAGVALAVGAVLFLGATASGVVRSVRAPADPVADAESGRPASRQWAWLSSVPLVVAVVLGVVAMYFLGRAS